MKIISRRDFLRLGGAAAAGAGSLLLPVSASAGPGSGQFKIRNLTSTWTIQAHKSQSAFGTTINPDGRPNELAVAPGDPDKQSQVQANDQWVSFFAWRNGSPHIPLTAAHLLVGTPEGDFNVTVTENMVGGMPVVSAPEISGWYRWKQPELK